MRTLASAILAVIVSTAHGWQVDFTARANNVGVQLETSCYERLKDGTKGRLTFVTVDYVTIDSVTSSLPFRRHNEAPLHDYCDVVAYVFANDNKGDSFFGDPQGDYIIEASEHVEQR